MAQAIRLSPLRLLALLSGGAATPARAQRSPTPIEPIEFVACLLPGAPPARRHSAALGALQSPWPRRRAGERALIANRDPRWHFARPFGGLKAAENDDDLAKRETKLGDGEK